MSVERVQRVEQVLSDGQPPDPVRRAAMHAALGEPGRLRIVDALAQSDLSPSELGALLGVESNLLAHHLDVLGDAGLVERLPSHADGRRRYMRLRRDRLVQLHRELPVEASGLLFVCTANSARSQIAAALWNAVHAVPAASAGTEPAERIHPLARRAATRRGLDLRGRHPARLGEVAASELVVTVCDRAHEQLRRRPAQPRRLLHWSIADPAEAGTPAAFDEAATELERRVAELAPMVTPGPVVTGRRR